MEWLERDVTDRSCAVAMAVLSCVDNKRNSWSDIRLLALEETEQDECEAFHLHGHGRRTAGDPRTDQSSRRTQFMATVLFGRSIGGRCGHHGTRRGVPAVAVARFRIVSASVADT